MLTVSVGRVGAACRLEDLQEAQQSGCASWYADRDSSAPARFHALALDAEQSKAVFGQVPESYSRARAPFCNLLRLLESIDAVRFCSQGCSLRVPGVSSR